MFYTPKGKGNFIRLIYLICFFSVSGFVFASADDRLIEATKNNDLASVQAALQDGANPDTVYSPDPSYFYPIFVLAACEGHQGIVDALLEAGAEVNNVSDEGDTALIIAVDNGHENIVTLLLDNGANPEITNDDGHTARDFAVGCGYHGIVQILDTWQPQGQAEPPQCHAMQG